MKNFKRVISAVIALALSASTLVAVSASKFSDVDSTNNYAEAIEVLTALDIAHGYDEEGGLVFKPNGDITRAEAATLIVGALNMMDDAKAAAGTSKFTDVNEKASWASGYVNVGVAQGFINGMDDTTFAPQENVTYAQMCVMLTLITGYGDYAQAYGGYPTGYTTMAASAGINKGVSLSNDTPLKRGQVAQMLYNALTAPLLGVSAYKIGGNEYGKQDGKQLGFKTLLSSKFDGYEAEVKIDAVPKSDTSLKSDEAKITLTKDAYLEQEEAKILTTDPDWSGRVVYAEADVADCLFYTGKAILKQDANDKWHLVYFKVSDADKEIVNAADYLSYAKDGKHADSVDNTPGDAKVTFGTRHLSVNSGRTTIPAPYTTAPAGTIYVNGKATAWAINEANVSNVMKWAQGNVTLIDDVKSNTTTGVYAEGYDKIMVTAYDVAEVAAITYTNETTTIQLRGQKGLSNTNITAIKIADDAVADGSVSLDVKSKDGEKVALSSIKKGDIIAYAVPVQTTAGVLSPEAISIVVTDEKVTGVVKRADQAEDSYTLDSTEYEAVDYVGLNLTVGASYTIALDPFGRLFSETIEATNAKYAVAESYDDSYGLRIILPDATAKYYEVNLPTSGTSQGVKISNASVGYTTAANSATNIHKGGATTNPTIKEFGDFLNQGTKPAIQNRVIKYTIKNSTGTISSIELISGTSFTNEEYKGKSEKLKAKKIIDTTAVINYKDYQSTGLITDYKSFAVSSFVDKRQYDGYVFADSAVDSNTAVLVLLNRIGDQISEDSRFAVVRKRASQIDQNGDTLYSLSVLYEGEEKDILCELTSGVNGLRAGDAFFFETNSEGYVESIDQVLTIPGTIPTPFSATFAAAFAYSYDATKWAFDIKNNPVGSDGDYRLVYGVVTDVTSRSVDLYKYVPGSNIIDLTNDTNVETFDLDAECLTYRYGVNESKANPANAITVSSPTASVLDQFECTPGTTTLEKNTDYFDLTAVAGVNGETFLTWALAEIVDGDVVAIYIITQ